MSRKRTQADKSWQEKDDEELPPKRSRRTKQAQNKIPTHQEIEAIDTCPIIVPSGQELKCGICEKKFKFKKNLDKHLMTHDDDDDDDDDLEGFEVIDKEKKKKKKKKVIKKVVVSEDEKVKKEKKHVCAVCGRKFDKKSILLKHEPVHEGEPDKPWICAFDGCCSRFTTEKKLKFHTKCMHSERKFKCDECNSSFYYKYKLAQHKNDVHNSVRYQCNKCPLNFAQLCSLKQHFLMHINPFECDYCGTKCVRKQFLTSHVKACSSNIKSKIKCKTCATSFSFWQDFIAHPCVLEKKQQKSAGMQKVVTEKKKKFELKGIRKFMKENIPEKLPLTYFFDDEKKKFCCSRCDFVTEREFFADIHQTIHI